MQSTHPYPVRARTSGWYPLHLTTTIRPLVHGGRAIAETLGRRDLPSWSIAETWEVSNEPDSPSIVTNGPLSGWSLPDLVGRYPSEILGETPPTGAFPLFTKFVDAAGLAPVQIEEFADSSGGPPPHAVWHVLHAAPGTTMRCGTRAGVDRDRLRGAAIDQDFDSVLRELPIRPGNTVAIPSGTPYSFGPRTLLYMAAPAAGVPYPAARWRPEDGSLIGYQEWREDIEAMVRHWAPSARPLVHPGRPLHSDLGSVQTLLYADPAVAVERWQIGEGTVERDLATALVVTNVGPRADLQVAGHTEPLDRARTVLLPHALRRVGFGGPADLIVVYAPSTSADGRPVSTDRWRV